MGRSRLLKMVRYHSKAWVQFPIRIHVATMAVSSRFDTIHEHDSQPASQTPSQTDTARLCALCLLVLMHRTVTILIGQSWAQNKRHDDFENSFARWQHKAKTNTVSIHWCL